MCLWRRRERGEEEEEEEGSNEADWFNGGEDSCLILFSLFFQFSGDLGKSQVKSWVIDCVEFATRVRVVI